MASARFHRARVAPSISGYTLRAREITEHTYKTYRRFRDRPPTTSSTRFREPPGNCRWRAEPTRVLFGEGKRNELFPAEQRRIIQLLVERIDVGADGVDIKLRVEGVSSLFSEMASNSADQRDAA